MLKSSDGSIIVGGGSEIKIYKFDLHLNLVSSVDLGDKVMCGVTVKDRIVCGMRKSKSLKVFNNALKFIVEVKL